MLKLIVSVLAITIAAGSVLAQAPTLRIVANDGPNLPAELYYGDIKVKPLRLRPGTNIPITIDDADFFVSEQYIDFLARFPDQGGLDYWTGEINRCGGNALCIYQRRVGVSAAFFIENEFQRTGSFVYRAFKGGLGRRPTYIEFGTDRRTVIEGPTLEQTKQAFALNLVQRPEFITKYNGQNTADAFADAMIASINQNSGVNLAGSKANIVSQYNLGTDMNHSRALALRAAIDDNLFTNAEYNPAFVTMQYFGYLKRDPETGGYLFWLDVLNNRVPNNYLGMVCAFITSAEYQLRFGSQVTQNDQQCSTLN